MIEKLAKMAENSAKRSANSGSMILPVFHQPKMPKSLIKKDEEK
ncbi:MAG: cyclic lactone autoinducer peptide [Clostridia bacterium]|nr:cyclic lactone autoinducer peptide [Clostridia bacterium]